MSLNVSVGTQVWVFFSLFDRLHVFKYGCARRGASRCDTVKCCPLVARRCHCVLTEFSRILSRMTANLKFPFNENEQILLVKLIAFNPKR